MASRYDVSFYKDLLHKPVVDCDGRPVGALLDLSTGPLTHSRRCPCVTNLVVRARRTQRPPLAHRAAKPLVVPWGLVASLEPRLIRLRQSVGDLDAAVLDAGEVLLRAQVMDQQIVDCRGLKLRRVNDLAMALTEGTLSLCGMDTGLRSLLTRLGFRWGLLSVLQPVFKRLRHRVIEWECVDRLDPARGWIRLRVSRDEVRSNGQETPLTPEA